MPNLKHNFDYIKINLASPKCIKNWGTRYLSNGLVVGEVKKPETLNYRTFKPEMEGLFCEKTFGPVKNWECYCGKYKRVDPNELLVCERCHVEITESRVRRHRMGFIKLFSPVTHVWYLKGIPSYLSLLLNCRVRDLEEIIYFNRYISLENFLDENVENKNKNNLIFEHRLLESSFDKSISNKLQLKIGAEAIKDLLNLLDLPKELFKDRLELTLLEQKFSLHRNSTKKFFSSKKQKREKLIRRIRLIENFIATKSCPSWMVFDILPVIPPGLRPMVEIGAGRFATSDLNELYRRVIIRNNRLARLLKIYAPKLIVHNEKRMLQEAIDALIDNGKRGKKAIGANNRPLKSLANVIEGKSGRFRQNLLGKRVDYSGRSVIVVGPTLKINQCGLPHEIALELFQPFIIHKLLVNGLVSNIKFAKKLIKIGEPIVWHILKTVLEGHPIILNRAPTLHRLGIQAFEPTLVAGRAIQLHPLVCSGFNADFDGDQMAIHIPLSAEAQNEAKFLMLAPNNFLSPATGDPTILPSQDMVLGCYYLTVDNPNSLRLNDRYFANHNDVLIAYYAQKLALHTPIWVKLIEPLSSNTLNFNPLKNFQFEKFTKMKYIRTTPGRILLNNAISNNLLI